VWVPKKVTIVHYPDHQKAKSVVALGNWRADQEAHAAALWVSPTLPVAVTAALLPIPLTKCVPHYSCLKCEWFTHEEEKYCRGGWFQFVDGQIVIPETPAPTIVKNAHWDSYMGKSVLEELLSQYVYVPHVTSLASNICKQCNTCAKNNPKQGSLLKPGIQHVGSSPFKDLKVHFTELHQTRSY
jgi:hypothetical protein